MIVDLEVCMNIQSEAMERHVHQDGFPGTRYSEGNKSGLSQGRYWKRTFSVDPQQGALCVPLGEDASLTEPRRSSILIDLTRNVVVG